MFKKLVNILKLIRPHQYVKNLFIFFPLFFGGKFTNLELLTSVFIAFIAFSFSASAVYVLNDYLDIEDDRKHPIKKFRPLASGLISKREAFILILIFSISGILLILTQSIEAFIIVICYFILNIAYSTKLKHISIIDITFIAIGFVLRLFIGSFVGNIILSKWIIIMTFLLALFLALAKRRDDVLQVIETGKKMRKVIDGYSLQLIDSAMMIMASVLIVTYILYTTSLEIVQRTKSDYLYMTAVFVILGILRYLQITYIENDSGSPTKIILKDKFIILSLTFWILCFVYILYL